MAMSQALNGSQRPQAEEGDESAMMRSRLRQAAQLEVSTFREAPSMSMYDDVGDRGGRRVKLDPLQWWARRVEEFPILARVARRVLATPATQVQAEEAFLSGSGPDGAPLSPEQLPGATTNLPHMELLVYLRNAWPTVDEWDAQRREATERAEEAARVAAAAVSAAAAAAAAAAVSAGDPRAVGVGVGAAPGAVEKLELSLMKKPAPCSLV
ncbi:unnamed protein product [Discosporangium mesarthrocarpum]